MNTTEKIIKSHLADKSQRLVAGQEIAINIDQTLTQDATGTLAYLEFEALNIDRIRTKLSVSYVDHNTLQTGFESPDDHRYLKSIAEKYGIIFSPAGNGICHQLHLENFGVPGQTLLGSDSHTQTAGALCMLAIGAGGLDIASALAGKPFYFIMPEVVNIVISEKLNPWVSAKDVILELLRKYSVKGGVNKIFEWTGNGIKNLDVPERATISNMGTELGLTSSIFPSDERTKKFLQSQNRVKSWKKIVPGEGEKAKYSDIIEINLSKLEPLIACPHSPDNVVKVREIEGTKIDQVCIGSCTNSSYRDLMFVATILKNNKVHPDVELVISPGSKQVLSMIAENGMLKCLLDSGARILESACGPCIGMGQAPPSGGVSLRTFNRNFSGRSGTKDASVYLCSPEVAVVSAINGKITDPRKFSKAPIIKVPEKFSNVTKFIYPSNIKDRRKAEIVRGPNIKPLPELKPLPDEISGQITIKLGDNISTDDILPAGAKILPLRSNVPAIAEYTFYRIDPEFVKRIKTTGGVFVLSGENYGQGSSREHAAIVLRYLGIGVIIAKSFARIHRANLINFGILPLTFKNSDDYKVFDIGDVLRIENIYETLKQSSALKVSNEDKNLAIKLQYSLTQREKEIISAGGLLNYIKESKR